MTAWMNLWMKEMKLGRKFVYGVLVLMVILAIAAIGFGMKYPYGVFSVMYGLGMFMTIFYLLAYLIVSFSNEKHSFSIWMQTPLPGWSLIAAKVLAGILSMLITLVVAGLLTLAVDAFDGEFNIAGLIEEEEDFIPESELAEILVVDQLHNDLETYLWQLALTMVPVLVCSAMIIATIYLIFFITNRMLRRRMGRWSILAAFFVSLAAMWLIDKLTDPPVMDLFDWGSFTLVETPIVYDGETLLLKTMPLGVILLSLLILGLVVFISGWLLDRKVEV